MNPTTELILTVLLLAVILVSLSLSAVKIIRSMKKANPKAVIVPAPDQKDFEPHPEWINVDSNQ